MVVARADPNSITRADPQGELYNSCVRVLVLQTEGLPKSSFADNKSDATT